jgi:hypothetical protein
MRNKKLCVAGEISQKSVSYFSVLEFFTGLHVRQFFYLKVNPEL